MAKIEVAREETELIMQIKSGQTDALRKLCFLYRPLIANIKKKYHFRSYDNQDWDQDAMIICYLAVKDFDQKKGNFASYYKVRLVNHANTLLRREMAYRRKAWAQAISFEAAATKGMNPIRRPETFLPEVPLSIKLAELVNKLSILEVTALLIILGLCQPEQIIKDWQILPMTLVRARSRLLQKARLILLDSV